MAVALMIGSLSFYLANAVPQGATITGSPSVDTGPTYAGSSRADLGGRIVTITLDAISQDTAWKAYVGNVSGSFVLQNSNNMSIYEWPAISVAAGELFVSRSSSVNWTAGAIVCANSTTMAAENTFLGFSSSSSDNINGTFNSTSHSGFDAGAGNSVSNCPSTALWVNDTLQAQASSAIFQEIVLSDRNNLIYAAILNDNQRGFDNTSLYDFQIIIPENRTASVGTSYYFYVELIS